MILTIVNLFVDDFSFFMKLLGQHIQISVISISIAIVIGGLVGIFISENEKTAKPILSIINFLYTIPAISMLGFLIPLSGIGDTSAIIALTLYALLPMVRNTYTGIKNVDDKISEAATGMGSTKYQLLYKIKIPLALPYTVSGIRSMVIMTVALAGIASFIGAGGLGVAIYRGITTNNVAMTIIGSLLIAILALLFDFILGLLEKRISSKNKSNKNIIISIVVIALIFIGSIIYPMLKTENKVINLATKPMTEQFIIGDMLQTLIEQDTDITVKVTQGVGGGTSNIEPAIENGEFDFYPEYTGTGWNMVLKQDSIYTEDLFNELQASYNSDLNLSWQGMYGFNNTYGVVVRKEIADKYNLKTISDLKKVKEDLIFGGEYDFFEREDGYKALTDEYGLTFASTKDMDIGLKYQAINEGKIDVMNIFTTDGQLANANVVVLEDNLNFYPSYMAGTVIRNDTLEKFPELLPVLEKMKNLITDSEMAEMNYKVEELQENPSDVALEFLEKKGLLDN